MNPAVTFGLLVGGKIDLKNSIAYWISQLAGAASAGFLLLSIYGANGAEVVKNGTPNLGEGVSASTGIMVELVLTFFLVFVVYGSAVDARAPKIGGPGHWPDGGAGHSLWRAGNLRGAAMNSGAHIRTRAGGQLLEQPPGLLDPGPMAGSGALAGLIYGRFLDQRFEVIPNRQLPNPVSCARFF